MSSEWGRRKALTVIGTALIAGCSQTSPQESTEKSTSTSKTTHTTTTSTSQTNQSTTPHEHHSKDVETDQPWPQYRLNAQNTGFVTTTGPTQSPAQYWKHEFSRDVRFVEPPVLDENQLYIPNYGGKEIEVVNLQDGAKQQTLTLPSQLNYSPSLINGVLYVPSDKFVVAINPKTGHGQWKSELSGEPGPITVANSTVFAGIASGTPALYALDTTTGKTKWQAETGLITAPPAVQDGIVIVGDWNGFIRAFQSDTGKEVWAHPVGRDDWVQTAPVISGDTVFVCSGTHRYDRGHVFAYGLKNGKQRWSQKFKTGLSRSPALADGKLYVADFHGMMHAISAKSGKKLWTYTPSNTNGTTSTAISVDFSPVVGRDTVYYLGSDEQLHAVNSQTGKKRWQTERAHDVVLAPILSGDYLFTGGSRSIFTLGPS